MVYLGGAGYNEATLDNREGETHMARILITGGAGFIGSHLVEYLLRQDHEILCFR